MNKKPLNIPLTIILLIAAILKLIHPLQLPLSHDELAMVLNKNLMTDGHLLSYYPTGVHVFVYYWAKVVGQNALLLKLPFIVCGVLSVYLIYKIGQSWFSTTTGLLCAAYMASLQYPIIHSQQMDAYSLGLALVLAMVYFWNKAVFAPEKGFYINILLFILFSALCAYNHNFSMLFAALVGTTGLFFVKKGYWLQYVIAGALIFVLCLPELNIVYNQVHKIAIEGSPIPPDYRFPLHYIYYIFHFSRSVCGLVALLVLFGAYYLFSKGFSNKRFFFISLSWFILPIVAGYLYGFAIGPVLQFPVLIFSFPFLLFCLFSWLAELPLRTVPVLLLLIFTVNIYSLAKARRHYTLFYHTAYQQPILLNDSLVKALGKDKYNCIIQADDSDKSISNYYIHKNHTDTSFTWTTAFGCTVEHGANYTRLIRFMDQQKEQYFAFGYTTEFDPNVLQIITDRYPHLVKKWDLAGGGFLLLSKKWIKDDEPQLYSYESHNNFEGSLPYWAQPDPKFICDTISFSKNHSYKMDNAHPFAPDYTCPLGNMAWGQNDVIQISVELYPLDTLKQVFIVSALESDGKQIEGSWHATEVSSFIPDTLRKNWVKTYHAFKLQDADLRHPNLNLKVYIWNKGRKQFYMDNFTVKTLKGNPVINGLIQKI